MSEFKPEHFISEIRELLSEHTKTVEQKLTSVLATNEILLKENIKLKKEHSQTIQAPPAPTDQNFPKDKDKTPCIFMSSASYGYRLWGKTYDVRSNIKSLGSVEWDGQLKSWKLTSTIFTPTEIKEKMEEPDSTTGIVCKFEYLE